MMRLSKSTPTPNRILGIDPGFARLGIAVIEGGKLIHSECFETSSKLGYAERLGLVRDRIDEVCILYKPTSIALETLLFSKNKKTALKIAEVRGVAIAVAEKQKISIREFHPNSIKIAITGYGKSDKRQVVYMIGKILKINKKIKYDDEYDAIAIALTAEASFPQLA